MFKWHWVSRSYAYKDFDLSKNGELSRLYNYAQAGYPISFLNSKDSAYHTLIITGFDNNRKISEKMPIDVIRDLRLDKENMK